MARVHRTVLWLKISVRTTPVHSFCWTFWRDFFRYNCGALLALLVTACLYKVCAPFVHVHPSCPTQVCLDVQLACVPDTLVYEDSPASSRPVQSEDCLASPVQTLPLQQPCHDDIFNGLKNVTCFTQKVIYEKWTVFEKEANSILQSTTMMTFVTEMQRSYSYSCKGPVNETLPRISYKEPLDLKEKIITFLT